MILAPFMTVALVAVWPGWGGPNRDFQIETTLRTVDFGEPFNTQWRVPIADGQSGIALTADSLITCGREEDEDVVFALDRGDGRLKWRYAYEKQTESFMYLKYGPGPHSTPFVSDSFVYCIGGMGTLTALDVENGRRVWQFELWDEIDSATRMERGYASSPLVVGDTLIVVLGGRDACVLAFDKATGKLSWRSYTGEAHYTSPIVMRVDDRRQVIALIDQELIAVDAETGEVLWRYDYPTVNAAIVTSPCPIGRDKFVAATCGYCALFEASQDRVTEVWRSKAITPQVGNLIFCRDLIIGPSSNSASAPLAALDVETGKRVWRTRDVGICFLLGANDGFIAVEENGDIVLAEANATEFKLLAELKDELEGNVWSAPAFDADTLYVRDASSIRAMKLKRR